MWLALAAGHHGRVAMVPTPCSDRELSGLSNFAVDDPDEFLIFSV